jgi:hypothetical protein
MNIIKNIIKIVIVFFIHLLLLLLLLLFGQIVDVFIVKMICV